MKRIEINDLMLKPTDVWLNKWFILAAGNAEKYNAMTVAWGSIGGMWTKPFVQVVVRPSRYTYRFIEQYETFTLSVLPKEKQEAATFMGTHSGKDCDKIKEAGLSVIESLEVSAPAISEAETIIECNKMYWQDMEPNNFLQDEIKTNYVKGDYHRVYFGEIVCVRKK